MDFNKIIDYCMIKGIQVRFTPEKIRRDHSLVRCKIEFFNDSGLGSKIENIPECTHMVDENHPPIKCNDIVLSKLISEYGV